MSLPKNFIENVLRFKEGYLHYRVSDEGVRLKRERKERESGIRKILSKEELMALDEDRLSFLADNLYAFGWWAKKEYIVDYWIKGAGGISRLRQSFIDLLYSGQGLADRLDKFRKDVKGIGTATITEVLTYFDPREYGIWNRMVREALVKLGLSRMGKVSVSRMTGKHRILKDVAQLLRDEERLPNPDLLDVHYFLYYVLMHVETVNESEKLEESPDHGEIINMLLNIGRGLGFDALAEVPLVPGTRVDVVWSAKIGNLGELRYVFEVQVSGNVDALLLNLMRASQDPTVQKVVAVATDEELEKIKREASSLRMISDKLVYWSVKEVYKVNELIEKLMEIMQRLRLTKM
ncbi:MAG: hypothetical protein RMJ14_04475 [Nitrososphaerota archaeon]|nr:hypothetical protein [Aigarchaeota archaeon]MDW8076873.1 hypothetical protein [Nitrososphaerota archaeon]